MTEPKEGYNSGVSRVASSGAIDSDGNYVAGGAAHTRPIPGTGETTKNRYRPAVTVATTGVPATNTVTWTAAENVTELTITVVETVEEASQARTRGALFVFDAVDDAAAKLLLAETGGASDDVLLHFIPIGSTRIFTGASYFTRADFKSILTDAVTVIVEAQ